MSWVLVAVAVWLLCSVALALLIARAIHLADRRTAVDRSYLAPPGPVGPLGIPQVPSPRTAAVRDCGQPAEVRPAGRRVGRR
jgi:hypothetical protein